VGRAALAVAWIATSLGGPTTAVARPHFGERPNVLVLVSDDQTGSTFNDTLMPNVYADLVEQGADFTKGYDVSALCCPSRSEILTGLYEHHTGVDSNMVPLNRPTIAEALQDAGYRTSLTGKYLNGDTCGPHPGWDNWICTSFALNPDPYVDPYLNENGTLVHERGYATDILGQFAADFIQSTPADQPFFEMYTPISPHLPADDPRCASNPVDPYRPPSYDEDTQTDGKPAYIQRGPLSDGEKGTIDQAFTAMTQSVECLDPAMGTILDSLGDRAQDTIVFYLSDNGYLYGEHRRRGKTDPYEESVHVPFVIRYPAMAPAPFVSDALVENVDIAPTIADLAGIEWHADGRSLVPLLTGQATSVRDAALIEQCQGVTYPCYSDSLVAEEPNDPSWKGVTDGHYKYVEYVTGERELYDLQADPYEMTNLADDPSMAEIQATLAADLAKLMAPSGDWTTIATGPQGDVGPGSYRFQYFSPSRTATYLCRLDVNGRNGAWRSCPMQSSLVGGLVPGSYVFNVKGSGGGIITASKASRAFTVVAATPDITIRSGPPLQGQDGNPVFRFSSSVPGATFECRLAEWAATAAWGACDPTDTTYGPLAEGFWQFQVRAVDPNTGDTSDPPAQWTFEVDQTGPTLTFAGKPDDPTNQTSGRFQILPDEEVVGPITCQLDGGDPVDCPNGAFDFSGLSAGLHVAAFTSTDVAGNQSAHDFFWLIDLRPPKLTMTTDAARVTNATAATFQLSSGDGNRFRCSLDGEPDRECASTTVETNLADGSHTFSAFSLDPAGNASGTRGFGWTVDTLAPTTTITGGPDPVTSSLEATFTFTADEEQVRFTCSLDGGPTYSPCASGTLVTGIGYGPHVFAVYGQDRAGNVGTDALWSWVVQPGAMYRHGMDG